MDFPDETLDLADRLAHEYKRELGNNKRVISRRLFSDNIRDYGYGYFEAASDGLWLRYPHEVKKHMECFEAGVYIYCVAEACGLQPRILAADGLADLGGNSGHLLVDVEVGNKHRVLIDPVQRLYGSAQYTKDGVCVRNNPTTRRTRYGFSTLEEVDKGTLIETIEYLRSVEGSIAMLVAGQQLSNSRLHDEFVHFNRDKRELEFQVRWHPPFMHNKVISKVISFDDAGDVVGKRLDLAMYSETNWETLAGRELLISLPYDDAKIADVKDFILDTCKGRTIEVDDAIAIDFLRNAAYAFTRLANKRELFSKGMHEWILYPHKRKQRKILAKKRMRADDKDELYRLDCLLGAFSTSPYTEYAGWLLDAACFNRSMKKRADAESEDEFKLLEDMVKSALGVDRGVLEGVVMFQYFTSMVEIFNIVREDKDGDSHETMEQSVIGQVQRYLEMKNAEAA